MKSRRIYKTKKRLPARLPQLPDILGALGWLAFLLGCAGIGGALDQADPLSSSALATGILTASAGVLCIHLSLREGGGTP